MHSNSTNLCFIPKFPLKPKDLKYSNLNSTDPCFIPYLPLTLLALKDLKYSKLKPQILLYP